MSALKSEFLEILSNYQGILHKVCLIYFNDEATREDNFQEIVYQLWKSYPKLKKKESIGSWIYAVSINTSIANLKKESKVSYTGKLPDTPVADNILARLESDEELRLLLEAIHKLDDLDKTIMFLYLEEKSYNEIAEITGLTNSNVGVRINRAKESLKKNLNHFSHGK